MDAHFYKRVLEQNQNKWLVRELEAIASTIEHAIEQLGQAGEEAPEDWRINFPLYAPLVVLGDIGYIDKRDLLVEMRREILALGSGPAVKEASLWKEEDLPTRRPRMVLKKYFGLYKTPSTWKTSNGIYTITSEEAFTRLLKNCMPGLFETWEAMVFMYSVKSGVRVPVLIMKLKDFISLFRHMTVYASILSQEEHLSIRRRYSKTKVSMWDILENFRKQIVQSIGRNVDDILELLTQ